MPEIDNLSIQISANETQAVDGLEKLARTLERLKKAVNGAAPTKSEAGRLRDFGQALNALRGAENIRISSTIATQIGRIGTAIGRITTSDIQRIRELGDALRGLNGAGSSANVDLHVSGNNGQQVAQATQSAQSGVDAHLISPPVINDDMDQFVNDTEEAAGATNELADGMDNVASKANKVTEIFKALPQFGKSAFQFGKSAFSAISYIPRQFGAQFVGNIQKAATGIAGFFNQIKRIATYRVIRSLIKFITQGFKEGVKNLYAWSNAADGVFASAMDRLSTSAKYAKNSLGAMASPLIEALAPAVDFVVDKLVDMFNFINQIFARLSGKTSYTAAKKVASQWDEASKSASGSAKKAADDIKRTILGFDEINKLNAPNEASGSGGGLGDAASVAASDMFEKRAIDGSVTGFVDQIKTAFLAGDWESLGSALGKKVNEIVDNINFANIGQKVGTYINGWFKTKYWTLDAINFTKIGEKIAVFLNRAIKEIDFGIIGRTLVQRMTIIGDSIIGFFTNFDFGQAAKKISAFVRGIYDELTKWFKKHDWEKVGTAIGNGLADFIANIDYVGLATSLYNFLNSALESGLVLLGGFFDGLADKFKAKVKWDSLSEGVQKAIEGIMTVVGLGSLAIGAVLAFSGVNVPVGIGMMVAGGIATGTGLSLMWDGLGDKIKSNIEAIKGVLYGASLVVGAILTFSGANIPLGLGLMVAGGVGLGTTITENWNIITDKLRGPIGTATALISGASLVLGILALCGGLVPLGIGLILAGAAGLAATVAANWDNLKDLGKKAIEMVKAGWDTLKNKAFEIAVFIGTKVSDLWNGLKKAWGAATQWVLGVWAQVKTTAKNLWSGIESAWGSATKWVLGVWAQVKTTARNLWSGIESAWGAASKWVLGVWAQVKTTSKNIWAAVSAAWGDAKKWVLGVWAQVKTTSKTIWTAVRNAWGDAKKWILGVWAQVKTTSKTIWTAVSNAWGDAKKWVLGVWAQVKTTSKTIWTAVSTAWGAATNWVLGIWAQVKTASNTIWKGVTDAWGAATNWVLGVWAQVKTTSRTIWSAVSTAWGSATNWVLGVWAQVKTTSRTIWSAVSTAWGDATNWVLGAWVSVKNSAQEIWNSVKKAWDEFASGKWLELVIKPVWDSPLLNYLLGQNPPSTVKNIRDAAMGKVLENLPPINATVDAKPGNGFKQGGVGLGRKQAFELDPEIQQNLNDNPLSVPANLDAGWTDSPIKALGLDNLSTDVDVDMWTPWGYWEKSPIEWLQMDNLKSTVDVDMATPWWSQKKSVIEWLQMDKLTATVNVNTNVSDLNFSGVYQSKAKGGIFSGNRWSDIPQYAGGTLNAHGSLFLAGEAGPEIVGHVGGRTEILNKSQLASVMYQAVNSAMQGVTLDANFYNAETNGMGDEDFTEMLAYMQQDGEAMRQQNELLRQQNELLRQINEKEFDVSTTALNRAQSYMNRRAGTTVVAVGT